MRTWCRASALTIYHPFRQLAAAGRLFVHTTGDPYALVAPVTRIIREMSADQPVERAATLADVRAHVGARPAGKRSSSGFAGVALLIAVVGVAGVLAFSVSARTREFGVRLAIGSAPRHLLAQVLSEGAVIASIGIVAGAACGYLLGRVATSFLRSHGAPECAGRGRCSRRPQVRCRRRVADAGRARVARRRAAGAQIGVVHERTDSSTSASTLARRRRPRCAVARMVRRPLVAPGFQG